MESSFRQAIQKGLCAARANIIPGIVIWIIAAAVIVAWHYSDVCNYYLTELTAFKNKSTYLFAFISTAIAGGVIPGMVQGVCKLHPQAWRQLKWVALFWGLKGMEINAFYEWQSFMFSPDNDTTTLLLKTSFDQLLYIPLWGVPSMLIGYTWIERGMRGVKRDLSDTWLKKHLLPVLLANWGVWTPTVALIYILPTALQLPLQNLVLCFWSLIMAFMTAESAKHNAD